jgi:translation initiation factor 2 subunit 3
MDNYKQIKDFVKGSIADKAPIVPVSAQHRLNIDALIEAMENNIRTPARVKNVPAIMHVLRSFDINKPGTPIKQVKGGIMGGALVQGEFSLGDEVEIRPGLVDEKKGKYEPILSTIATLGTGAGLVENVKPGGLVAIGTKLDPTFTKSDSLIGSIIGKPGSLPKDVEDITVETHLFDTAVGTAEMVRVEPIKVKEPLRLNIGTAASVGTVTSVRDGKMEVKLKKPVCLLPRSRVAISRRIAERWRLIGSGIAV